MKTSIIILTRGEFPHTFRCLDSIRNKTTEPYEIIVVDNGSTDMTIPYLTEQADVTLIQNDSNLGFAKGCNQGAELATGDQLLFLNNDTIVTPNWLTNMLGALNRSEEVGIVGPLTNYSSGHQRIGVTYSDLAHLDAFAIDHSVSHAGTASEVPRLIGFCMLMRSSVFHELGGFDERYGLGNFEDDDLCLQAANAGYLLLIAHDSFIHHVGHVTTDQLSQTQNTLAQLLTINREKAHLKWGADIHHLLYKPYASLTCCILLTDSTDPLQRCVASLTGIADEIIVIDPVQYPRENSPLATIKWLEGLPAANRDEQWKQAFAHATMDYIFLLAASEYVTSKDRRRLRALKRMAIEEPIPFTLSHIPGQMA